jgi:hypothetical protein
MDFVLMATVLGLLSSGTAHQPCASGASSVEGSLPATGPQNGKRQTRSAKSSKARATASATADGSSLEAGRQQQGTAWSLWLHKLVQAESAAAGLEKGAVWAFALAQSLRNVASDVAGQSSDRLDASVVDLAVSRAAFDALVDLVCDTSGAWGGATLQEAKTVSLLLGGMEAMVKVRAQPRCCCVATGDSASPRLMPCLTSPSLGRAASAFVFSLPLH